MTARNAESVIAEIVKGADLIGEAEGGRFFLLVTVKRETMEWLEQFGSEDEDIDSNGDEGDYSGHAFHPADHAIRCQLAADLARKQGRP